MNCWSIPSRPRIDCSAPPSPGGACAPSSSKSRPTAGFPTVPGRMPRPTRTAGRNGRNAVMFGPPGRLYTYRSHGIHVCANVSCAPDGTAAAVLLRAAALEDGTDVARARRGELVRTAALARGPGNLCSAMGIIMDDNGIDLFDPASPVTLELNDPLTRRVRSPRRRQPGRRPAVAIVARGPTRGLGLPPQPPRPGAGRQRLAPRRTSSRCARMPRNPTTSRRSSQYWKTRTP